MLASFKPNLGGLDRKQGRGGGMCDHTVYGLHGEVRKGETIQRSCSLNREGESRVQLDI